jgi:hypothetical protein
MAFSALEQIPNRRTNASGLMEGLHPTHRKERDGWGTLVFVWVRKTEGRDNGKGAVDGTKSS